MISLTPKQHENAKKNSVRVFGKVNLSGYLQYLIQQDSIKNGGK
jgi:hypothetical protein